MLASLLVLYSNNSLNNSILGAVYDPLLLLEASTSHLYRLFAN